MWQDEIDAINNSSGLYLAGSPRKAGSDEPGMAGFPSTLIEWLLS
jgi:hypothetical protein